MCKLGIQLFMHPEAPLEGITHTMGSNGYPTKIVTEDI